MKQNHIFLLTAMFLLTMLLCLTAFTSCGGGTQGTESDSKISESTSSEFSSEDDEGLRYILNDDTNSYSVVGIGTCTDADIVIPTIYNGKPVTSIGESAFNGCINMISIEIPDSVTSIGKYAFNECSSLTSIRIPDSVTSIGADAFCNTGYYKNESNWEDGVLYIGKHLIKADRTKISTQYVIKAGTLTIADYAFPVEYGADGWAYCYSLTSLEIPDSVTSIGEFAFFGCTSLTNIEIRDSVKFIGAGAFYGGSLESITVSKGNQVYHSAGDCLIETASKTLIAGCQASVIPTDGSVTSIGKRAFFNNGRLTSIKIPDSVTSIGEYAFYNCRSLIHVVIGNSVTSIGERAFYWCGNLTDITFIGTQAQWNAIGKGSLWDFDTPLFTIYCSDGAIEK